MTDERALTPEEEALLKPARGQRRTNMPTRQVSLNPAVSKRTVTSRAPRKPVSPKEYAIRLARSEKRDIVLVEEKKKDRLESSAEAWHKLVGPRFRDADTDNPIILNRANRVLIGSDAPTSVILHGAQMGTGKAQPVSEPVLTPQGFIPMGSIKPGMKVIGSDGEPKNVLDVFPQGIRDIYKVMFNDGSYTLCDGDHLWSVQSDGPAIARGHYKTMTTLEILKKGILTKNHAYRYAIPHAPAIEFAAKELPLTPYVLGTLLSDGYLGRQNIMLSNADDYILQRVREEIPAEVSLMQTKSRPYDYRFKGVYIGRGTWFNPVKDAIRLLGLVETRSHTKFIPNVYLQGSIDQRIQLLRGLMDTGGETSKSQASLAVFSTASEQLAKDVTNLVQSLGGIARLTVRNNIKGANHPSYCLHINTGSLNPFALPRKAGLWAPREKYVPRRRIAGIVYSHAEEAQCIMVDSADHLYVTRNYILTHNTWLGYAYINEAIKIGAATPGQVRAGTENIILGRIAVAGWQRADYMAELLDPKYKIYFIDDVGLGYFGAGNSEHSRQQVWYELINHVYMHDLTLILTTNREVTPAGLGSWVGEQAYDRLRALVGKGGLIEPGHVNRRPGIAEAREEKARNSTGRKR